MKFSDQLPEIGKEVSVDTLDGNIHNIGKIEYIKSSKDLSREDIIFSDNNLENKYWSITTDKIVNAIVRPEYEWEYFNYDPSFK